MFYLLYKEKNESSFKAINKFAKQNNIKKIGHTGTLDPLATGLLLVATDDDTKLISYIKNEDKTYIAEIQLGASTDTYDIEGQIINNSESKVTENDLEKINNWFLLQTKQVPPIFSAKKINGKKAYEIARKGENITLKDQPIKVFSSKIISFDFARQILKVELKVSKGTYIRSLINDLGNYLGCYAYMTNLERTCIGLLSKKLLDNKNFVKINITPILELPIFLLNIEQFNIIKNGNSLKVNNYTDGLHLLIFNNEIIGLCDIKNNFLNVKKLFGNRIKKILKENYE